MATDQATGRPPLPPPPRCRPHRPHCATATAAPPAGPLRRAGGGRRGRRRLRPPRPAAGTPQARPALQRPAGRRPPIATRHAPCRPAPAARAPPPPGEPPARLRRWRPFGAPPSRPCPASACLPGRARRRYGQRGAAGGDKHPAGLLVEPGSAGHRGSSAPACLPRSWGSGPLPQTP